MPVAAVVTPGPADDVWAGAPATRAASRVRLGTVVGAGLPASVTGRDGVAVAVDLTGDPGPWLPRVLLAANADRLALLVPNQHPDLSSERAQRALTEVVGPKYS